MSLLLQQLFNFFKLLNSETGHNQIAAGICLGLVLGLSPILSLQAFLVFFIMFLFRVQIGAAFLSAFFFKFIGFFLDPLSDILGRAILEQEGLRPFFSEIYNMPLIPFTQFNNSIVMGSGILAFSVAPFLFPLSRWLIIRYRQTIANKLRENKLWKAFAATALYKWYNTYRSLYEK